MSEIAYSDFFRSKNLLETAWYGTTNITSGLVRCLIDEGELNPSAPLSRFCEGFYKRILNTNQPEYAYKNVLLSKTVFGSYSPSTTSWLYEFKVGSARADAVLVNGTATAFEIKTDLDDFSRAMNQLSSYYSCFDRVIFVVGNNQINRALELLPSHVGILSLSKRLKLSRVREPETYQNELSSEAMFHILRCNERSDLQRRYQIDTAHLRPVDRYGTARDSISKIDPLDIHGHFVEALRLRAPSQGRASITAELPPSLRAAVFGYKIRRSDWKLLASRLNEPASNALE